MFYTYILKSVNKPTKRYVGYSSNVHKRLVSHNLGKSTYTKKYRPWEIIFIAGFLKEKNAICFEKYLKSHSGKAFMNKRLV